jgi:TonB family protein
VLRRATIIGSLALHVLVFGYALRVASRPKPRATSIAVVGEKKKSEKPEPPKPRPKPIVAAARPQPKVEAAPTPAPVPEVAPTPAPVESGLTFDNSSAPGIDLGGKGPATAKAAPAADKREKQALKKEKALLAKDNPEEDNCTEAPSKPQPLTRPSDIEYTQDARANGVEGRLVLRITVGADGAVADVQVQSSVEAALDAAAIAAVKTWTFKPAMRCGKSLGGGVFTLARRFELGD